MILYLTIIYIYLTNSYIPTQKTGYTKISDNAEFKYSIGIKKHLLRKCKITVQVCQFL
jgi:hypothetical protein